MNVSRREWLVGASAGVLAVTSPLLVSAQEAAVPGALSEETLGKLLDALGLKPKKTESRYDFTFASKVQDDEWNLSMSAVLSADNSSIWVMAWLDELPRSARDVPRTALLRLLAANDKMGKGKFFSYIPTNRRFALQQVVDNREMSSKKFRGLLVELGQTVALTYPQWSTNAWKDQSSPSNDTTDDDADDNEPNVQTTKAGGSPPTRNAVAPTSRSATRSK